MLCLTLGCAAVRADDVTLVKDGASEYVIVLAPGASASEQWAAKELVDHVKLMSGATLAVQKEGAAPAKAIVLGFGPAAEALGVKADATLGKEGYVIKTVGTSLVIAGGRERGTMYGVYTLLEKLGVRWWTPTETTIPSLKTITVPTMDVRDVPPLEYRDMMYPAIFPKGPEGSRTYEGPIWAARNKVNGMAWEDDPKLNEFGGRYAVSGNLVHSYNSLLKDSGVTMTDAMWAQKGGKPQVGKQPCLSNPDVLAAMVKAAVARYKADPTLECVVVGQEDNNSFCECEACAAIDKEQASHSGQVIAFANKVAEAVEKEVPGAKICTAAYEWSRKPPASLKPRENVYITLCSIECDYAHPLAAASNPENKAFKEDIEGWAKIAPKLLIWHYSGNRDHYFMPNPDLETFTPNVKFFADHRAAGVFVQGTHVGVMTEFTPLRMWLWAKALWNPNGDNAAYIAEFVHGYYGAAAPAILKYIDLIHSVGRQQDFHLGRRAWLNAPFLKPEIMADAEAALREAQKLVKGNADLERRVRHARMPLTYVLFKRGPQSKTWAAVEAKVGPLDPVALAAEFAQAVKENDINYTADPEVMEPWVAWMQNYAKLIVEKKGKVVPPELENVDPATYRLVQGCQFDMRSRCFKPAEGASDGWALTLPAGMQMNYWKLSPYDDYTPGKTYKVFARVRTPKPTEATGAAWSINLGSKTEAAPWKFRRTLKVEEVKPDEWQVYEVMTRAFTDGDNINPVCAKACAQMEVDCLWLVETAAAPPAPAPGKPQANPPAK